MMSLTWLSPDLRSFIHDDHHSSRIPNWGSSRLPKFTGSWPPEFRHIPIILKQTVDLQNEANSAIISRNIRRLAICVEFVRTSFMNILLSRSRVFHLRHIHEHVHEFGNWRFAAASSSAARCVDACVTLYSIYNFKYFYSRWSCDQVSHHDLTDTPTQKVTKLFLSGDELYCEFYSWFCLISPI
jgi:hypothetical protein